MSNDMDKRMKKEKNQKMRAMHRPEIRRSQPILPVCKLCVDLWWIHVDTYLTGVKSFEK